MLHFCSWVSTVYGQFIIISCSTFTVLSLDYLLRYVLTQFNSHTLNTHIAANYPPIVFGGPQKRGFVDVLTASQTPKSANWYKGSADAVRQQLDSILDAFRGMNLPDELLVLSGQAIYKMVRVVYFMNPPPLACKGVAAQACWQHAARQCRAAGMQQSHAAVAPSAGYM